MSDVDPYRLIVESVRDYALLLLDRSGVVTSWNPGAEAIKGYAASEIIGRHFSVFYPPEDRATRPARELEIAAAAGRFEEEGWRVRKDGTRFWAHVVLTPVKGAGGEVVGFAKVTRDLTERRKAEEKEAEQKRLIHVLSTPAIRLWPGILFLPIVGDVDQARANLLMKTALERAVQEEARIVIIDVAGSGTMDTEVAGLLLRATSALALLGARTILTGISPQTAKSMVNLGIDLRTVVTQNQLAAGVELALRYLGKAVRAVS